MQVFAAKGLYSRNKNRNEMKIKSLFSLLLCLGAVACSVGAYDSFSLPGDAYVTNKDAGMMGEVPPSGGDSFDTIVENPFVKVADAPSSSFSVDADGAAYAYMRSCLNSGYLPGRHSVRIEEYLNYFTFDYADPAGEETLAINAEVGPCPWKPEHLLLRLGLKGKSLQESEIPAANYILLVDVSGSMSGVDRIELLKTGLVNMVEYMRPQDRVAIITYSGSVKKLLESTLVSEGKADIQNAIKALYASGATAGGEAMKMAYEEAAEHYIEGGNNRIVMCTDGDFNVGVSSTEALVEMVESYQDKGIYLSIMGFGRGNYQDSRMENLSSHGNGTYTYIDSEEEMMKVFVQERSHFCTVANDTKCQVRFNAETVDSYRLIGYENRVMSSEEFEDSKKDAGEIGAGQTVTALYELIMKEGLSDSFSVGAFEARYKLSLKDEESRSLTQTLASGDVLTDNFNFASAVAAFGLTLLDSEYKGEASIGLAYDLAKPTVGFDPGGYRAGFLRLLEAAKK